jgi:molecular chaperone DnaK (HSP70)
MEAQAAKKAGIHPVTLIKEPEAAAIYTLNTYDQTIKVGQ